MTSSEPARSSTTNPFLNPRHLPFRSQEGLRKAPPGPRPSDPSSASPRLPYEPRRRRASNSFRRQPPRSVHGHRNECDTATVPLVTAFAQCSRLAVSSPGAPVPRSVHPALADAAAPAANGRPLERVADGSKHSKRTRPAMRSTRTRCRVLARCRDVAPKQQPRRPGRVAALRDRASHVVQAAEDLRAPGSPCAGWRLRRATQDRGARRRRRLTSRHVWRTAATRPRISPTPPSTSTTVLENPTEAGGAYSAQSAIAKNVPRAVTERSSTRATAASNGPGRGVPRQASRAQPQSRTPVSATNRLRAARTSSSATMARDALTTTSRPGPSSVQERAWYREGGCSDRTAENGRRVLRRGKPAGGPAGRRGGCARTTVRGQR